ncbi:hypothetical protein HPP92_023092 [Vanilla planifolia]|uniref:FAE domain-containing protein n=1 Tax=Vanilla planifolia TaxID=51239 RepID=A0A835PUH6_VANPL|nr:hypothetical protein HPP92_023092 [Vanilla planifolia]
MEGSAPVSLPVRSQSRRLPDFLQSVKLKYVKLGYHYLITHLLTLLLIPIMVVILVEAGRTDPEDLRQLWIHLQFNLVSILVCSAVLVFGTTVYIMTRQRPVYLVDYACYRPPAHLQVRYSQFMEHSRLCGNFNESALEFQCKILERSGLGEQTYVPDAMHYLPRGPPWLLPEKRPSRLCLVPWTTSSATQASSRRTSASSSSTVVSLIPPLSFSAMIVNRYKLRGNILSFNLGGMGCSAGVISIDLARDLLQVHRNTYAVVVSTENITQNWYFGNRKSMLIPNCLFRVGGAAILLSNRSADRRRAKYRLIHVVRTHRGADDRAFRCVYQEQDDDGRLVFRSPRTLWRLRGRCP